MLNCNVTLSSIINIISLCIIFIITVLKMYITLKYIFNGFTVLIIGLFTMPMLVAFLLFPIYFTVSNMLLLFTPNSYWKKNSKYFINTEKHIPHINCLIRKRPSITIQIPVYDEDFIKVIRPTLRECIKARNYYGKNCNIVVNDDGLFKFVNDDLNNIVHNKDVIKRITYYKKYNIGFTARKLEGRKGKFKKASNMNFGQYLSDSVKNNNNLCNIHDICVEIQSEDEKIIHDITINKNEKYMFYGSIKLGKYILLIDSDTTIPEKILPRITDVFERNREIGYIQHYTLPLKSSYQNFFSRKISLFTQNLYHIIFRVCTRNGDIAPLIGHNVTLRKSALAKLNDDGYYWNDDRVSEDFDTCLKMYQNGYKGVYMYDKEQSFGEGVSLSYKDEIVKYSKFAYGASEILFYPIRQWHKKGIITKSFYKFMNSKNVPFSSKVGILGYLMTYFSISFSIILTPVISICSCFVSKWELLIFDPFYAYLFMFIIYGTINPFVIFKLKYQFSSIDKFKPNLWSEYKTGIFFSAFYCSISFPQFIGIISHLFGIHIMWGSTVKNLKEDSNKLRVFFDIIKVEKIQILYSLFIISLTCFLYVFYTLSNIMLFPMLSLGLGHLLIPFIFNPLLFRLNTYKFDVQDTP